MDGKFRGRPHKEEDDSKKFKLAEDMEAGHYCRVISTPEGSGIGYAYRKFIENKTTITSASAEKVEVYEIDSERVLTVRKASDAYLYLKVCKMTNLTFTSGSEVSLYNPAVLENGKYFNLVKINTDRFVMMWKDGGLSTNSTLMPITISDKTITCHTSNKLSDAIANRGVELAPHVDNDKFVAFYRTSDSKIAGRVCSVSGNTISVGAEQKRDIYVNRPNDFLTIAYLEANKYAVGFGQSEMVIASVSGDTITFGDSTIIEPGRSPYRFVMLSSNICVVNVDNYIRVIKFSNGVFTLGKPTSGYFFGGYATIKRLSDTQFVMANAGSSGNVIIIEVNPTTLEISAGTTLVYSTDGMNNTQPEIVVQNNTKFVIFYQKSDYYIAYCACTVSGTTITKGNTGTFSSKMAITLSHYHMLAGCKIRDGYIFLAYLNNQGSTELRGAVFQSSESDGTCSFVSQYNIGTVGSSNLYYASATQLADNKILLVFDRYSKARIITITDTTVGSTSEQTLLSGHVSYVPQQRPIKISDTKFLMPFCNGQQPYQAKLQMFSLDGSNNITSGNVVEAGKHTTLRGIGDYYGPVHGAFFIGSVTEGLLVGSGAVASRFTVSGDTLKIENEYTTLMGESVSESLDLVVMSPTKIARRRSYYIQGLMISGNNIEIKDAQRIINIGGGYRFNFNGHQKGRTLKISPNHVFHIGYASGYIGGQIIEFDSSMKIVETSFNELVKKDAVNECNACIYGDKVFLLTTNQSDNYLCGYPINAKPYSAFQKTGTAGFGIVQQKRKKGQQVRIAFRGDISKCHKNLISGKNYYLRKDSVIDGELTTEPIEGELNILVGVAKSDTELYVIGNVIGASLDRQQIRIDTGSGINYFSFEDGYLVTKETS